MDALPYVDVITREETKEVERLIAEEMERSEKKPKDYLKEMTNVGQPLFGGSRILQAEYRRVKSGTEMEAIDTKRYTLPIPSIEEQNDPEAWQKALDNARAQLEHQRLRRALNLELALKYGPEAWKLSHAQSSQILEVYERHVSAVKLEITDINTHRKLTQLEAGERLNRMDKEWHELVMKNSEILQACNNKRSIIRDLNQSQQFKRSIQFLTMNLATALIHARQKKE